MDPLKIATRPDPASIYKRGDANDRRMGDTVFDDPGHLAKAEVVIVGCPQDEGVRRNKGREGAAGGPEAFRRAFYRLAASSGIEGLMLFDLGDVALKVGLEETHELLQIVVRQLLLDGKRVIVVGGGNDISYPDCAALLEVEPDAVAFNIDAHFDVRADSPRNSGTPYRMLLDERRLKPDRFHEFASQPQANSFVYGQFLKEKGVAVHPLETLHRLGCDRYFQETLSGIEAPAVFFGFDLDAVRASDAPGVSAPSPVGLRSEEVCAMALSAGRCPKARVMEITELNPRFDLDGRTARLASLMAWNFLKGSAEVFRER